MERLTALPWGVELWGTSRHPVQIYAAVLQVAILFFLWRYQATALPGETFWLAVALIGIETLWLDAFRADVQTWMGGIRVWTGDRTGCDTRSVLCSFLLCAREA